MKLTPFLLIAAAAALVPAQSQAVPSPSYTVNSGTVTQSIENVNLSFRNETDYSNFRVFDSTLGTLNSVTFHIDAIYISGSFGFSQGGGSSAEIRGFSSAYSLYSGVAGGGYAFTNGVTTDHTLDPVLITVSNYSLALTVPRNTSRTLNLTGQNIAIDGYSFNVSSGNFTGNFTAYDKAPAFAIYSDVTVDATTNGGSLFNWDGVNSYANLSLVYNYTEATVPESSTYGIGLGVLALAAVAVRRRKVKA